MLSAAFRLVLCRCAKASTAASCAGVARRRLIGAGVSNRVLPYSIRSRLVAIDDARRRRRYGRLMTLARRSNRYADWDPTGHEAVYGRRDGRSYTCRACNSVGHETDRGDVPAGWYQIKISGAFDERD